MKQKRSYKKIIGIIVVIAALVGACGYAVLASRTANEAATKPRPTNTVDYGPPTKAEKNETKAFKDSQQNNQDTPSLPETNDGRNKVTPTLSYAGYADGLVEVSAYIPQVIEEGGTCTLKLSHDSTTITRTSEGLRDATTTRCTTFSIDGKEINPKGTWTATVTYSSLRSTGTSSSAQIEVQ